MRQQDMATLFRSLWMDLLIVLIILSLWGVASNEYLLSDSGVLFILSEYAKHHLQFILSDAHGLSSNLNRTLVAHLDQSEPMS